MKNFFLMIFILGSGTCYAAQAGQAHEDQARAAIERVTGLIEERRAAMARLESVINNPSRAAQQAHHNNAPKQQKKD